HTRSKRDWSADVCSSDLTTSTRKRYRVDGYVLDEFDYTMNLIIADYDGAEERTMGKVASSTNFQRLCVFVDQALNTRLYKEIEKIGRASCRERGKRAVEQ